MLHRLLPLLLVTALMLAAHMYISTLNIFSFMGEVQLTHSFGPPCEPGESKSMNLSELIILIHSGAALKDQRDRHRQICFPSYKAAGIEHYFVVGMPSFDDRKPNGHYQGQRPTERETNISLMLLEEQSHHGDILVTPNRDYYRDKTEKILGVLRYGVEKGAKYIIKPDDDYCVNVTKTKLAIQKHEMEHPSAELYAGVNYFKGTEYASMKGPHNETAPFMSGHLIVVSRKLAMTIVGPDWMQNILKAAYGTSSDDANLGKMVARARTLHNVSVKTIVEPRMKLCKVDEKKNLTQNLRDCHVS